MSLKNIASRLPRPIKELVKRKLNQHGFYDIRDGRGLAERGFYDIRGVDEMTTIHEFKEQASRGLEALAAADARGCDRAQKEI